jgi:arsenate reductase (thioredoxin)
MSPRPCHVLVLCTGNSARSILGEALLNHLGQGRVIAHSAGSQPKGAVHPLALAVLGEMGLRTDGFRSKSWDEFAAPGAPQIDFILTVCDNAAGEACPVWPGKPITAHWGIADPAAATGTDDEKRQAFRTAASELRARIQAFLALPVETLERTELQQRLRDIGRTGGCVAVPRGESRAGISV